MAGFNRAELDSLERREFHLSILAATIVLVMAGGVALLMYPLVFVPAEAGDKWTLRFAFVGFCILSILFVVYLLDRQRTVRRLKQQLVTELERNLELRRRADADLLNNIPGMTHFQDRLTMEYRRASNMQRPLSLVVVTVKLQAGLAESEQTSALGEAARGISRNLRPTDSMYSFGPCLFGLVLPDTDRASANSVIVRLEDALRAAGSMNKFSSATSVCTYPHGANSARELEQFVVSLLPDSETSLIGADQA
jgi:GGDEF domain-containing protein